MPSAGIGHWISGIPPSTVSFIYDPHTYCQEKACRRIYLRCLMQVSK